MPRARYIIKRRLKCRKRLEFGQLKQKKEAKKKEAQAEKQFKADDLYVDRDISCHEQTEASFTELIDVDEKYEQHEREMCTRICLVYSRKFFLFILKYCRICVQVPREHYFNFIAIEI